MSLTQKPLPRTSKTSSSTRLALAKTPATGRAHLVGAAGAGMRSLARVLRQQGWQITGSDTDAGAAAAMVAEGVHVHHGHDAARVPHLVDWVITSDAVADDNPERLEARRRGIPTLSYFEMVGRLMEGKTGLAVAGTHGKSTTTAMAAQILVDAGLDPTVLCGAAPLGQTDGGRAGQGRHVLAEACEYRAHFLHLRPTQAVLLGIEPDHFDCYATQDELEASFRQFVALPPTEGLLLARDECPATGRVTAAARCRVETFGMARGADWSARYLSGHRGRYRFEIFHGGHPWTEVSLLAPGRHNVLNALAAAALAASNGVAPEAVSRSLGRFQGIHRRLESLGTWGGVTIVDDYAHHPTEVAATLETLRRMYPGRRLCCVFQPHQAGRTRRLLDELAQSLDNVDVLQVAEIFRAREPAARPGDIAAADLARRLRARGVNVVGGHDAGSIVRRLETGLEPGDVLVIMGAGNIREICNECIQRFRTDRAAG